MSKWKSYPSTDKLAVIASIKHRESQTNMSHENGMPELTICWWLKDKEKLHDFIDKVDVKKKG